MIEEQEDRELEQLLRSQTLTKAPPDFTHNVMRSIAPIARRSGPHRHSMRMPVQLRAIGFISSALLIALFVAAIVLPRSATQSGKFDLIFQSWADHISSATEAIGTSVFAIALAVVFVLMAADTLLNRRRVLH